MVPSAHLVQMNRMHGEFLTVLLLWLQQFVSSVCTPLPGWPPLSWGPLV